MAALGRAGHRRARRRQCGGGEHFLAPNFARRLRQHLSEAGAFGRSALEIEITESAALQVQQAKRVMDACHRLGVPISLDDFGTGYSSIFYLNELPFDALKVDPSFTRQMLATSDGWAIVLSMLLMGTAAHLEVIAEGVETTAHEEALVRLGVRWAQGYTYARPMPAGNLPDWLARWPARLEGRDLSPSLGTGAECLTALHLHTRWVSRLLLWANHPETALDAGEMLNEKRCQFTQWLAERTDARPGLATIAQVHRRAHSAVTSAVRETRDEDLGAALTAQLQAEDQRLLGAILAYRAVADGLRITAAE